MPGAIEESNVIQKPGDLVVGRGGIGNLEQHRKWQVLPEEYPPRQAEPVSPSVPCTISCVGQFTDGLGCKSNSFDWKGWNRESAPRATRWRSCG